MTIHSHYLRGNSSTKVFGRKYLNLLVDNLELRLPIPFSGTRPRALVQSLWNLESPETRALRRSWLRDGKFPHHTRPQQRYHHPPRKPTGTRSQVVNMGGNWMFGPAEMAGRGEGNAPFFPSPGGAPATSHRTLFLNLSPQRGSRFLVITVTASPIRHACNCAVRAHSDCAERKGRKSQVQFESSQLHAPAFDFRLTTHDLRR